MTTPDHDTETRPVNPETEPCASSTATPDHAGWLPQAYRVPPARRIGLRRRQELAAFWLERLGQAVTAEAVDALAPVAGRYPTGTYARQEADKVLRGGHVPDVDLVQERLRDRAARDAARSQALADARAQAAADLQSYREDTSTFIHRFRGEHNRGPTWAEVSASLGWTRRQAEQRLQGPTAQPWDEGVGSRLGDEHVESAI